jgi:hypothetical protein
MSLATRIVDVAIMDVDRVARVSPVVAPFPRPKRSWAGSGVAGVGSRLHELVS